MDSAETVDGLAVSGIRKAYGDTVAPDGLSMHGFVGPNGAGKAPAMRIVLGVLGRDAGPTGWRRCRWGTSSGCSSPRPSSTTRSC